MWRGGAQAAPTCCGAQQLRKARQGSPTGSRCRGPAERECFATHYGAEVASERPELREWQPVKPGAHRTAARLRVGHALPVTETGLAFMQDARRSGDLCAPLDWIPEVYHPLGSGEAVIPDALLHYRRSRRNGEGWSMLRAFVEVDQHGR
ncbi:replication-relaxation family protein [Streptomyces sp. NBC_00124]|uniref:replication-relaxation family protein n=1 Tax=Streptomyces sp. NBC_00124 TaxID=2975662 RepID=UPI002254F3CF|nr:replication-relaxation family protein [Streptomyces sp. NBC_00124]MCX5367188.1 replication-relaxation family protein [Streptomyces sp. NBC_00124]